ncbi:unnamed protein product [Arctia plantaginis]|uniref:RING finger protein 17 n=1 Tax=Arctia plantaginis TaxID=874455 RepID=A0A8S0ZQP7_ARCPL|nr:unnamed protein product [Arctia plantaginis]
MDNIHNKICPNCSQIYNLNLVPSKSKTNLPLFLPCGHSMCENCILNIIKCMEPIECKVCQTDVDFKTDNAIIVVKNPTKLREFFPVNVYMVGELTVNLLQKSDTTQTASHDHFLELKAILKNEDVKGQCLECRATTSKMCQQCATILCDSCFNKSHKNFVIFRNHELQDIDTAGQPNFCKIHKEKSLEYYCHNCCKAICMDCMMVGGQKSCKNHNVVSIQEVNESFMEDLNGISPQVDEIFRRLTKTAVDIGYLLLNYENDTGSATDLVKIIASIDQHFSKLMSIVQKHKKDVINIILNLKCSERDSLENAKSDVVNSIKKAKSIMKCIKAFSDPQKLKQANITALLEDAKDVTNAPWYLNKDDSNKEALKINVNEDLCSLINDYVQLEGNVKSVYKLYSTAELDGDVEIPPPPKAPVLPPELPKDVRDAVKPKSEKEENKRLYKKVPRYHSKSGSVSSLNSLGSEGSYKSYITQNDHYQQPLIQTVSPFPESQVLPQLHEGSQELIYISHIVDPHNFYVQRASHQGFVKEMLREFRNAVSFTKPSTNHISMGKTYLAFNKADNMWQRCRVIQVDKSDPTKQPLIEVFYFDFGSIETVTIDRLRLIPAPRIQCPYPLALNCSLANCQPKSSDWTSSDSILIQNIIDNKQAVIHIRRIIYTSTADFKLECDVITFEHGVSLAHALAFHDRAIMPNPKQRYPQLSGLKEKPKIYMSHNDFKTDTTEAVYITHVVSPDKFYVRKQHLQAVYEKICEDLDQEYNLSSNIGTVYLPELGMVCVVNVDKYNAEGAVGEAEGAAWARGVVTELPGRGRVRVLLPDTGLELLLHWTKLRHIHNKFTAIRAIATECHLAGVTPLNKKWAPGSVTLLKKYEGSLLELQVEDSRRNRSNQNRGSIGVTLHDKTDPENIICINHEMIKYKYAVTIGAYMFHKNRIEETVVTNKSPLDEPKIKSNKITVLKNQDKTIINEIDLEAKDKGPLRLEAKILHYQSPSLIYISLVHQVKAFNELFEKIQKHYSKNKTQLEKQWKVGDRCCTMCNQSQTWRRSIIMEFEGGKAKVFYCDFACIETVPISSLRELTAEFASFGDAAIMCHLYGIIPAVGEEWPSLTKEFLKELLDIYKRIFITKIGNFKEKSMPIEIWVYHTIQGDALEPNKSEWRCLNKKIIEQGLGVPDKSQMVATKENTETDRDGILSFLNITGSVNEWLQLDPLPIEPITKKSENENIRASPSSSLESDDNYHKPQNVDISNVMYVSDWLPPEPVTTKEFTGIPTYIDNTGVIYLHDVAQTDTLDLIRKALEVRFKSPDPKAKYTKWSIGEPCVALYYLDNRYYRGRVVDVDYEALSCVISYVDYGNEDPCTFSNLRKSVPLHQIPIQARKFSLSRIRPVGGSWDRETLDYLHKSVVDKKCHIKVTGDAINGITPIEIKYEQLSINDHLVDFEMAEYTDGSKSLIKKFAPVPLEKHEEETITIASDSGPDYIVVDETETDTCEPIDDDFFEVSSMKGVDWNKIMDEPIDGNYVTYPEHTNKEFTCNITIINDLHVLELTIISDEDTTTLYEQLFEDLQVESQNLPLINGIFENKACIAIFPDDGQWYRASILQFSEAKKQIKVRYVDYGNTEVISIGDTREILDEWTKLPPATISAKLYGVKINPQLDIEDVTKEYAKVFLDRGPFKAKIVTYENSIPLVELKNYKNDLIYKELIEKDIFIVTN